MGLETVELLMELEDHFGVSIPDSDAQFLTTPRGVTEWLMNRLAISGQQSPACPSARAFYRLRRGFSDTFGADRCNVRPETLVASLVPADKRRGWWRFTSSHGLPRPPFKLFGTPAIAHDLTVSELVLYARAREECFDSNGQPVFDAILRDVCRLTSEQSGVALSEITADTHFVRDLHMD